MSKLPPQSRTNAKKQAARPPSKLGAEKLTAEEQKRRFEELARELECDESEEHFEAALRVVAKHKPTKAAKTDWA